jgi:tetratricopeptide (TPR) repeat protein
MHRAVFILVGSLLTAAVAADPVHDQRLRQAVSLPSVELSVGMQWSPEEFERLLEPAPGKSDPATEAVRLRRTMRGSADDAERYQRLGLLYRQLKKPAQAKQANWKAITLSRQRLRSQPRNPKLLIRLGELLTTVGQDAGAEEVLRRAVRISPKSWAGWIALGECLLARSFGSLSTQFAAEGSSLGEWHPAAIIARDELLRRLLAKRPGGRQLQQAQKLLDERQACFDQAVRVAPAEPRTYLRRAASLPNSALVQELVTALREGESRPNILRDRIGSRSQQVVLSPRFIQDLRQLSRLRPQVPHLIAVTAFFEVASYLVSQGQPPVLPPGRAWEALPETVRQPVRRAIDRLEKAAQNRDTRVAAAAAEQLGLLQFLLMGDQQSAEANAQRATRLDPSREQAWDIQVVAKMNPGQEEDLLRLCEEWMKLRDTPRSRLFLAKAYAKLDRLDKAEEQTRAMLKRDPTGFTANLATAVVLMKRQGDPARLVEAREFLSRARKAPGQTPEQQIELRVAEAIHTGLAGDPAEARKLLSSLLEQHPDHQRAREALAALESES